MTTFKTLPLDEIRIVKTISISSEMRSIPNYAEIIYTRKLSPAYCMKKSEGNIERLFYDHDENIYPNDSIDDFILAAVKKTYPDAKMKSSLMMFDVELEHYKHILSSKIAEKFNIRVNPRFDDMQQVIESGKNEWKGFSINLELFCYPNEKGIFKDSLSICEYNINKEMEFDNFWNEPTKQVGNIIN